MYRQNHCSESTRYQIEKQYNDDTKCFIESAEQKTRQEERSGKDCSRTKEHLKQLKVLTEKHLTAAKKGKVKKVDSIKEAIKSYICLLYEDWTDYRYFPEN
jgi:hypothetical protein